MHKSELPAAGNTVFTLLNQFFDHVYVVTIARASHRHVALEQALKGLDYELFMGADATLFSKEEMVNSGL